MVSGQNSIGDCIGAIPVCQTIYVEENSPSGAGLIDPEVDSDISCIVDERNSAWYIFTILEGDELGFTITPQDLDDDYDWCLYNITNSNCEDIHKDITYIASCNSSGGIQGEKNCHGVTGADGSVPYSFQNFGCGNDPPNEFGGLCPLNALVPVQKGDTYVLLLDNWSESQFGYTLDFTHGNAIIVDTTSVDIIETKLLGELDCYWDGIRVTFTERIDCSETLIDQIKIRNEKGNIIDVGLTFICQDESLGFTNEVEFRFNKPIIQAGTYTLELRGAVPDLCGNYNINRDIEYILDIIPPKVYIPNVFTPNNDGVNDKFKVFPNVKVKEIEYFGVYDRWGNLAFEHLNNGDSEFEWDGRIDGSTYSKGTYSFIIRFIDSNDFLHVQYGTITIL